MKINSIFKSYLLILLVVGLSITACGGGSEEPETEAASSVVEVEAEAPTEPAEDESEPEPATEADSEAESSDSMVVEQIEGITTDSGLQFIEVEAGDGPKPTEGDLVQVHYTGKLLDGTEFDSSVGRDPFTFTLGQGQVISGWDEGIALLNEGGKAMLIIPPDLAYGSTGAGGVIPPDATLMFDVELVQILEGSPEAPVEVDEDDFTETDSGLKYHDFEVGEGDTPEEGAQVSVHYTGWLTDGTKFDSSLDRGSPISFVLGQGQVIPGWDEGLSTMQVGGKRQLLIPPDLAYGDAGAGGVIPPDATLIFEVELVGIQE